MKLYNLFENVIFEEIQKARQILTEAISIADVEKAIDGKYNVKIKYKDSEDELPSDRYIQVYNLSKTKAGNLAIRAYQISGGSKGGDAKGFWKIFRLDKIEGWTPTQARWKNPVSDFDPRIPKYNADGDKSMSSVLHKVNLDEPITNAIAKTPPTQTSTNNTMAKPVQKPATKQPVKTLVQKPVVKQPVKPAAQKPVVKPATPSTPNTEKTPAVEPTNKEKETKEKV